MQLEPLKIVIPSYKRADRVLSKRLFERPIICVCESEKREYERLNPECEILTHPDSVRGLVAKRNWIADNIGDCFMIDDDVVSCHNISVPPSEKAYNLSNQEIYDTIQRLYRLAILLDVHLFGFSTKTRPCFYNEKSWYALNIPITGCAYGIRQSKNIHWDTRFTLKEDFLISSTLMFRERNILTCQALNFVQRDTGVNRGGLSEFRNKDEIKRNILLLRKFFGESIKKKPQRFKNEKESINVQMSYKI